MMIWGKIGIIHSLFKCGYSKKYKESVINKKNK